MDRPHRVEPAERDRSQARSLHVAWAALVVALVIVHCALPLHRPVPKDTMFTGGKMLLSWAELLEDTRQNPFPPLFFVAMKAWCSVAGVSLAALLAPGAVASVLTPCVFAWALRPWITNPWTRWLAAALAGVHLVAVLHGSEIAKPYAELRLLAAFGAGAWIRVLEAAAGGRSTRGWTLGFAAACVVGCQLHFPGLFLPGVVAAHAMLFVRRDPRLRRAAWSAVAVLAVSGGSVLVWTERMRTRLVDGAGLAWVEGTRPPGGVLVAVVTDLKAMCTGADVPTFDLRRPWETAAAVAVVILAGAGIAWLAARGRRPLLGLGGALIVIAIVLPVAALVLLEPIRPLYFGRYVAVLLLPIAAACAVAAERTVTRSGRWAGAAVALALVGGRVAGLATAETGGPPRGVCAKYIDAVRTAEGCGATLVVLPRSFRHETWTRWIDHEGGPPPSGLRIDWSGPEGVAAAIEGHRRALVVPPSRRFDPSVLGLPPGWRTTRVGPVVVRTGSGAFRKCAAPAFVLVERRDAR